MATNAQKMIDYVKNRTGVGIPENPVGLSIMKDEDGKELLKLGFLTYREIISEIGFYADPDMSVDVVAAMAAVTELAKDTKVMEAFLMKRDAIEEKLSDDGKVDEVNKRAVMAAELMLKEAIRYYSAAKKAELDKENEKRANEEKSTDNPAE